MNRSNRSRVLAGRAAAVVVILLGIVAGAHAAAKTRPYPLNTCIITGEKLGEMGAPVVRVYDGREVKFCCNGCVGKFEADPTGNFAKIDAKVMEQQRAIYPLETCLVDGKPLVGPGAQPVEFLVNDRLVRTDSPACRAAVEKDPAKYIAKLDEAVVAKQLPAYPLSTCPVLGGKLGGMGEPVNYVFQGRLVRFCCKGCIAKFDADPFKYLSMIDAATPAADPSPAPER
jgi:YHS domain-containing protein